MNQEPSRQEHSAGGCVFKKLKAQISNVKIIWLLGKHSGYHKWVLPKGLIEAGEKPEVTAVREVAEETGVSARIVGDEPIFVDRYSYRADYKSEKGAQRRVAKYQESGGGQTVVHKTVTYYLMEWVEGDPRDHDWEMEEAGWFSGDDALALLAFAGEQQALKKAIERVDK